MFVNLREGDGPSLCEKEIAPGSVDLMLVDLPYGITAAKWDHLIPFEKVWRLFNLLVKEEGVACFTASQPFSSALVLSNPGQFRHEWVWVKDKGSNFANTVREPMKEHETVLVFTKGKHWTYNPIRQPRAPGGLARSKFGVTHNNQFREGTMKFEGRPRHIIPSDRLPSSVQHFRTERGLHPTQKPISLMSYLISTYTKENDTVLDFCMGSGTAGVASLDLQRNFFGVEKEHNYYEQAKARILNGRDDVIGSWD